MFLRAQGIDLFRLHQHGDMVRIEVSESGIAALKSSERRNAVVSRFKELGFLYVTLDLTVFHSGGVNQSL